jgi:hypothetical protein
MKTIAQWRKTHPGAKALILMPVSADKPNVSFILTKKEKAPEGLYKLLGILD